jgi:hypothetical protein
MGINEKSTSAPVSNEPYGPVAGKEIIGGTGT